MLLIECPWCGPRAEIEFTCGGQADIVRPPEPDSLTDEQWGDYLFMRHNTRGEHREQWLHAQGCRRWFKVTRNTVTGKLHDYEIFGAARVAQAPGNADKASAGNAGGAGKVNHKQQNQQGSAPQ